MKEMQFHQHIEQSKQLTTNNSTTTSNSDAIYDDKIKNIQRSQNQRLE